MPTQFRCDRNVSLRLYVTNMYIYVPPAQRNPRPEKDVCSGRTYTDGDIGILGGAKKLLSGTTAGKPWKIAFSRTALDGRSRWKRFLHSGYSSQDAMCKTPSAFAHRTSHLRQMQMDGHCKKYMALYLVAYVSESLLCWTRVGRFWILVCFVHESTLVSLVLQSLSAVVRTAQSKRPCPSNNLPGSPMFVT